jgi:magnesium-transporting ATPase (P-type)
MVTAWWGEGLPDKLVSPMAEAEALADRESMIYPGTTFTSGRGTAVVTATGTLTEFGAVAHLFQQAEDGIAPRPQTMHSRGITRASPVIGMCTVLLGTEVLQGALPALAGTGEMRCDGVFDYASLVTHMPFHRARRRMTTVHRVGHRVPADATGAPQTLAGLSAHLPSGHCAGPRCSWSWGWAPW